MVLGLTVMVTIMVTVLWFTAGFMTVVSDRITSAFNRSGATWAVTHDIFKAFDKGLHASFLHKFKLYEILG